MKTKKAMAKSVDGENILYHILQSRLFKHSMLSIRQIT